MSCTEEELKGQNCLDSMPITVTFQNSEEDDTVNLIHASSSKERKENIQNHSPASIIEKESRSSTVSTSKTLNKDSYERGNNCNTESIFSPEPSAYPSYSSYPTESFDIDSGSDGENVDIDENLLKKEPMSTVPSSTMREGTLTPQSSTDHPASELNLGPKDITSERSKPKGRGRPPGKSKKGKVAKRDNGPRKKSKIRDSEEAFDIAKEGCYACWLCSKTFSYCMHVKEHIQEVHCNAFGAYLKSEDDSQNDRQFLHFCPKNCDFVTPHLPSYLRHVTICTKPMMKTEGVETQEGFSLVDHDEDNSGDVCAEDLDVSPQQSGHSQDTDGQGGGQEIKMEGEDLNDVNMHLHPDGSSNQDESDSNAGLGFPGPVKPNPLDRSFECSECGMTFTRRIPLLNHMRIHTGEKPFQCKECLKCFGRKDILKVHMRLHTGEKPYHCVECDKGFTSKSSLLCHKTLHTGETPFPCSECGKCFRCKDHLRSHMRIHASDRVFNCKCELCHKVFSCQSKLLRHMRSHTGEKPFQCDECGQRFSSKHSLEYHIRGHSAHMGGNLKYKCNECSKSFQCRSHLLQHFRTHTGEKPFVCHECGQRFTRKYTLDYHIRGHTGERRFKCKECGEDFDSKKNLDDHMRIHTGEQPVECSECGRTLRDSESLARHMRIHTGDKPYKCGECGKSFNYRENLLDHIKSHSQENLFKCNQCEKTFVRKLYFVHHMRSHEIAIERPFQCNECSKSYDRESQLHEHVRKKHARLTPVQYKYKCDVCGKLFCQKNRLESHVRIHTGEKPFKCDECGKFFGQKNHLGDHKKTHTGERPFKCDECGKTFARRTTMKYHMIIHTREYQFHPNIVMTSEESFSSENPLHDPMKIDAGDN